ncbi:hypothetical protein J2Z23_002906 [Lederbergia galactosidilyticus]|nr:hypothetical protein [Lederbergia galactosidilytica]
MIDCLPRGKTYTCIVMNLFYNVISESEYANEPKFSTI